MSEIKIYKLVRSHRKSIALMISPDATLIVRAPLGASLSYIQDLVKQKRDWIETKLSEALKHAPTQKKTFTDGEEFLFLGEKHPLKIYDGKEIKLAVDLLFPRRFLASPLFGKLLRESKSDQLDPHLRGDDREFRREFSEHYTRAEAKMIYWYKEKAIEVIAESANHYSQISGWKFKTINITSAQGRWGSCSSTGSINFTWKLIMAPLEIVDYVVVHELAHIAEKNHSSRFWNKVQSILPDYKARRKWLKDHGKTLIL